MTEKDITVWAFNGVLDPVARDQLHRSVGNGKSRFGWSQIDEHNLNLKDKWTDQHPRQLFLLQISPGDWIVHINLPQWGECIAAQVVSDYGFDEGLLCPWGRDFRHCFDIDITSIVEFERNDPNVVPTVNLNPRSRYHRVYAVGDFMTSLANLRSGRVMLEAGESRGDYHMRDRARKQLTEIADLIHKMHRGKTLERFLAKVFRRIPTVVEVNENGFGFRTDHGADLIVTTRSLVGNLQLDHTIVVQVKSFADLHEDLSAVEQVVKGMAKFSATAGMIVTTGSRTEELERRITEASEEAGRPIDLLAAEDVAKFVIKHAPDLLFDLSGIS